MRTTSPQGRADFDPGLGYEAAREFRLGGVLLRPGERIDPSQVDARRMRQLYDARHIRLAAVSDARRAVARKSLRVGGVAYGPGDAIPRDAFASPGRLAQMVARGDVRLRTAATPRAVPRRAHVEQ